MSIISHSDAKHLQTHNLRGHNFTKSHFSVRRHGPNSRTCVCVQVDTGGALPAPYTVTSSEQVSDSDTMRVAWRPDAQLDGIPEV